PKEEVCLLLILKAIFLAFCSTLIVSSPFLSSNKPLSSKLLVMLIKSYINGNVEAANKFPAMGNSKLLISLFASVRGGKNKVSWVCSANSVILFCASGGKSDQYL